MHKYSIGQFVICSSGVKYREGQPDVVTLNLITGLSGLTSEGRDGKMYPSYKVIRFGVMCETGGSYTDDSSLPEYAIMGVVNMDVKWGWMFPLDKNQDRP